MTAESSTTNKSTTVRSIQKGLRSVALLNPRFAAKMATWLFFRTPPRLKTRENESIILGSSKTSEFKFKKNTIKLWEWGNPNDELILLVHGWGGRGAQMTPFVAPLLESGFRVIAMDLAGHGDSSGSRTSIPEMADMLIALVEEQGEVNSLIAHSMGNSIAMLALKRGLKLKRYVGIAGPVEPERWFRDWVGGIVKGDNYSNERARVEQYLGTSFSNLHSVHLAELREEPMLWIHDRDDREVPFSSGVLVTEAWSNSKMHETEKLGHRRILRDPEVVSRVTNFVANTSVPFLAQIPFAN